MANRCAVKRRKIKSHFHAQKGLCCYCSKPMLLAKGAACGRARDNQATLEHVVPVSAGGTGSYANTAAACFRCNNSRGDADARIFYLKKQGYLS